MRNRLPSTLASRNGNTLHFYSVLPCTGCNNASSRLVLHSIVVLSRAVAGEIERVTFDRLSGISQTLETAGGHVFGCVETLGGGSSPKLLEGGEFLGLCLGEGGGVGDGAEGHEKGGELHLEDGVV